MPIHDWTRVDAGLFHAFHQSWIVTLCNRLNAGVLPKDYFALPEQVGTGPISDAEVEVYASKADRISVRQGPGDVVAVIEIVSPGNKKSRASLRTFVEKIVRLLEQGIHALVIDLFPPSERDPRGIHKALWDEVEEQDFDLPADKQLVMASYLAGSPLTAYLEPMAVGDALPDMPLFLESDRHVLPPLEKTYALTWMAFPDALKGLLDNASQ